MYFNNCFNIDKWNSDAKYLIFDDMDFDFVPARKCFFGAQKEFTITDKYRGKRTVQWGKPLIYLSNGSPFDKLVGHDYEWYMANSVVLNLTAPLFN